MSSIRHSYLRLLVIQTSILIPIIFTAIGFTSVLVNAKPLPLKISQISAPYPKHCLDERQWKGVHLFNPYNILDGLTQTTWQPCDYALKDAGYTVHFSLEEPIQIDGFELRQALKRDEVMSEWKDSKKRKRQVKRSKKRKEQTSEEGLRTFKRIQILFFNQSYSERYPFYFQEVKFNGKASILLEYRDMMAWNSILVGDSGFDERRRALGLDSLGFKPPITIDRFSLVFWETEGNGVPPALTNITFKLNKQPYQLVNLNERRQEYAIQASKVYDLFTSDYMLVGDDRTMIFSRSGTIWGMVGDEEEAQVLGAWRFHDARIEVDLSQQQKRRTSGKQRKILARQRDQSYQPLHLILDQAPSQSIIVDGPLAGNYDLQRVPVPTVTLENDQDETAPMFESP